DTTICDNQIYVDNIYYPATAVLGIGCAGVTTKSLKQTNIHNNTITFNPNGNFLTRSGPYNAGIQIYPFILTENVKINGNTIVNPPGIGIAWEITNSGNGKSKTCEIRHNTIRNAGRTGINGQIGIWLVS